MNLQELLETINSPVNLLPHQVEHVDKIWNSFMKYGELSYIDTSRTGLGKTHIALEIAYRLQKLFGMRVGIVAPNQQSIQNDDGWLKWAEKYGIVIEKAITYASLRGRGGSISNGWLIKDPESKKKGYHATEHFRTIAKAGLFLIFDEFHMATRESSTHFACSALARVCARYPSKCRIGLLSLTPGDKDMHYPQIVRLTGLIQCLSIVKHVPFSRDYIWEDRGLGEMIDACVLRGADRQLLTAQLVPLSMGRAKHLIGKFYNEYVKNRICFAMPAPTDTNKITMRNCFLKCYKDDIPNLNDAISKLCDGASWDGYEAGETNKWNLGQINVALKEIERYKLRTIARYIGEKSQSEPNKKFIVSMGSRGTVHFEYLQQIMSSMEITTPKGIEIMINKARMDPTNVWSRVSHDVLNLILTMAYKPKVDIMTGETKVAERVKILRRFQAKHSDSWCLLISPGVGDKSISLHDKHGNHPRELIVVPDHYHTRLTQITGRTNRIGVQSDVEVSLIYCKETRLETSVLHSMARKSKTAKDMLATNQDHLFPGNFDIWVEKDRNNVMTHEIRAQMI